MTTTPTCSGSPAVPAALGAPRSTVLRGRDLPVLAHHGLTDHVLTDHVLTDHGLTDHVLTDHVLTDHGLTDHVLTDHGLAVPFGADATYPGPRPRAAPV